MAEHKEISCRIAVDAMGGDYAPQNVIMGAISALEENPNLNLFLVGNKDIIKQFLSDEKFDFSDDRIIHAEDEIGMSENPTTALKTKRNSSIVVGAQMVAEGRADAFVSAGNTGAMMAASTLIIGRIKGVGRPTIGAAFPSEKGITMVYDVGASVDSKAQHILEYAKMGSIYLKEIHGIHNPSVGLLSVGEEESKGNSVSKQAFKLLQDSDINFTGNVEGRDILKGTVDIVVCDGFVGNILLKFGESVTGFLKYKLKDYASKGFINKLKVLFMRGTLKKVLKDLDYQAHGGVPLLGVKGISIIGHGSSSPLAFKNMILKANEMHEKKLIHKITEAIGENGNQK